MIAHAGTLRDVCLCSGTIFINGRCSACQKSQQTPHLCRCSGKLFINGKCAECGGAWGGANNTVAGPEDSLSTLERKMKSNLQEFQALVSQFEKLSGRKSARRKGRKGLFTKKILDKVEDRFPSGRAYRGSPRKHHRQKR